MSERQQRVRLGLFVVVSLGLFATLILLFSGAPHWFTKFNEYSIIFSDAPGITPGTPVRKSGVKVGEVSAIDLDDMSGQVRVTVQLDRKFTPRSSDEPAVTRGLLVGDTAIDFVPRNPDKAQAGDPIPPGAVIQGVSPFNARLLIDQAAGVVPEAQKSLEQVRRSLEAMERMTPQIQTTFKEVGDLAKASREFIPELRRTNDGLRDILVTPGDTGVALQNIIPELQKTNVEIRYFLKTASFWVEEAGVTFKQNEPRLQRAIDALATTTERLGAVLTPENQRSITEILKNVNQASSRFDQLTMSADDLMKDGKVAMKTLNSTLAQADQALTDVRQLTRPLAERTPRILENVENGSDQFNKTMVEVREIVKAIGRSDGALQKFIGDPALYNNLNETLALVGKQVPRIERILKDVEVFADKIARHPEALGVGGAIRPSAGLKEAPTPSDHRPLHP